MANLSNINNVLRVSSDLRVGINTDAASYALEIGGTNSGIKLKNSNPTNGRVYSLLSDTSGNFQIYDDAAASGRLVINSAGNATFAGDVSLLDNKILKIGTGNDLELYHNNSSVFSQIRNNTGDLYITNLADDKDIIFQGDDAGSVITALTLDMSNGGSATFRDDIDFGGKITQTGTGNNKFLGNVGVGMTPDTSWGTNSHIINLGIGNADAGHIGWREKSGADELSVGWNVYHNNTNWYYASNNPANLYTQDNGTHKFQVAAGGTADNIITWTDSLSINSSGKATFAGDVGIGGSPDNLLTLQGTAGSTHQRFKEASSTIGFIGGANGIISSHDGKLALRAESGLVLSSQGNAADVVISSGNVGIGTTDPSYGKLQIDQTSGNNLTLRKGTGSPAIAFGGVTNNEATFLLEGNPSTSGFKIYNGSGTLASPTWTAGMDFHDGGRLHPYGGVFLGSSNNDQLLNYYKEGTWTPTIKDLNGNLATLSAASGTYTKIGRQVFLNYRVQLSSKASMANNYVLLGGLPFNHPTGTNGSGTIDYFQNMATGFSSLAWDTTSTGSVCWLVGNLGTSSTSSVYVTPAQLTDTTILKGTIIYMAVT